MAHGWRVAEIAHGTKRPPAVAQKTLPNPLTAAKKEMRDSGVIHQALSRDSTLGTLRRLCQRGEEDEEKALWPLSGTAVSCQQPHCSQQTHSSNPGLAASQFLPHLQAQGSGSPANQAMEPAHQESPRDPHSQTSVTRIRLKHFLHRAFFGLQDAQNRSFHEQTIPMAACRQPKKP